jgi:hypothetical protein
MGLLPFQVRTNFFGIQYDGQEWLTSSYSRCILDRYINKRWRFRGMQRVSTIALGKSKDVAPKNIDTKPSAF